MKSETPIKSIQLLKTFTFGNVLLDKLTNDQCEFEKTKTSILVMRQGKLFEVPISFCVIEYV